MTEQIEKIKKEVDDWEIKESNNINVELEREYNLIDGKVSHFVKISEEDWKKIRQLQNKKTILTIQKTAREIINYLENHYTGVVWEHEIIEELKKKWGVADD